MKCFFFQIQWSNILQNLETCLTNKNMFSHDMTWRAFLWELWREGNSLIAWFHSAETLYKSRKYRFYLGQTAIKPSASLTWPFRVRGLAPPPHERGRSKPLMGLSRARSRYQGVPFPESVPLGTVIIFIIQSQEFVGFYREMILTSSRYIEMLEIGHRGHLALQTLYCYLNFINTFWTVTTSGSPKQLSLLSVRIFNPRKKAALKLFNYRTIYPLTTLKEANSPPGWLLCEFSWHQVLKKMTHSSFMLREKFHTHETRTRAHTHTPFPWFIHQ